MNYIKFGSKAQKRASFSVMVGSIITFAIMYSPQPLISLYSKQYHIPPQEAGLSISLTTIALAVSLFFVSALASVWSRKNFMSVSLILTSCLSILTAFTGSFHFFLVLRLFEGIAIAGFPSIAMAYLNEEFSPRDIGSVMGYYVAGTAIGGFAGRIIIGFLTDLTNWHSAFLFQGILSLIGSVWFFMYLPNSANFTRKKISLEHWVASIKKTLFNKHLISMYIIGFLLMGAFVTISNYIGYPLTKAPYNLSQTVFGFLFVVNIFGMLSSIIFGKLADRFPRKHILALSIIIFITGVLLTLNGHLIIKIIGVATTSFGFMAGHSVASSWTGLLASTDNKGQAASFYLLFYYTGSSLLGWSGGIFLNQFGWNGVIGFVCFLLTAALLVTYQPWGVFIQKTPIVSKSDK